MRFGICGDSLWLAARLLDEGADVVMYHPPPPDHPFQDPRLKHVGEGLVPLSTNWWEFVSWLREGGSAVCIFDRSGNGKKADDLRSRGVAVVGASVYNDRLEGERGFAMELAERCGIAVPDFHGFGSITQSMTWIEDQDEGAEFFFKTDRDLGPGMTAGGRQDVLLARMRHVRAKHGDRIKHILQEKVDGVDVSTAAWWNGRAFLTPFEGTVERKEWGNDDTGPKTGCAMNAVWYYAREPAIVEDLHFDELAEVFRKNDVPPGLYDTNVQLRRADGLPYFLEFSPRFGFDATPVGQRLLESELAEFFDRLAHGTLAQVPFRTDAIAFSLRLAVPPFPYEAPDDTIPQAKSPIGLPLLGLDGMWGTEPQDCFIAYSSMLDADGEIALADPSGIVGLSSQVGTDLEALNTRCVAYARGLGIADLGYRTDGGKALNERLREIRELGHDTGPAQIAASATAE